jgi:hypothetical protein
MERAASDPDPALSHQPGAARIAAFAEHSARLRQIYSKPDTNAFERGKQLAQLFGPPTAAPKLLSS